MPMAAEARVHICQPLGAEPPRLPQPPRLPHPHLQGSEQSPVGQVTPQYIGENYIEIYYIIIYFPGHKAKIQTFFIIPGLVIEHT